jgi:hypothetical protein
MCALSRIGNTLRTHVHKIYVIRPNKSRQPIASNRSAARICAFLGMPANSTEKREIAPDSFRHQSRRQTPLHGDILHPDRPHLPANRDSRLTPSNLENQSFAAPIGFVTLRRFAMRSRNAVLCAVHRVT